MNDKWLEVKMDLFRYGVQSSSYLNESQKRCIEARLDEITNIISNKQTMRG